MPPSDSQSQNEFHFPRNMKLEGLNNVYCFGRHILPVFQPYVINIQDVKPYGSYYVLRNTINWQQIAPAPVEHWMFMPHTGLVVAQRFGVLVHLFSSQGAQNIFPLWTSANSLMRHNVVSVVHLGVHFVNVTLQGYYPMPTVNPIWKRYRNDAASNWEFVYHDRPQKY
ncbi:hypothetical protein E3N88_14953 [Mikania micrantha]|uniref:Uncharacterized protein n=1 Tax=Mikania micrantha TaxID=192012 RepID=A0A5N6P4V8_9ASTR|nr:hypothetical protein E3N88_14953 [Mikania micrantha]